MIPKIIVLLIYTVRFIEVKIYKKAMNSVSASTLQRCPLVTVYLLWKSDQYMSKLYGHGRWLLVAGAAEGRDCCTTTIITCVLAGSVHEKYPPRLCLAYIWTMERLTSYSFLVSACNRQHSIVMVQHSRTQSKGDQFEQSQNLRSSSCIISGIPTHLS